MEPTYKNTSLESDEIQDDYYDDDGWSETEWDDYEASEDIYEPIGEDIYPDLVKKIEMVDLPNAPQHRKRSGVLRIRDGILFSFQKGKKRIKALRRQLPFKREKPDIVVHKIHYQPTLPQQSSIKPYKSESQYLVPMSTIKTPLGIVRSRRVCRCSNGCICPSLIIFPPKRR